MKNLLLALAFFLSCLFPSNAKSFQFEELKDVSFDLQTDYVTRYMFRGFDTLDDEGAIQPSLTANLGESGLWLNFWGSFGLDGGLAFDETRREDLDELDWTIGYDRALNDDVSISAGYTLFQFPNVGSEANINEFFAGISLTNLPLTPSVMVYYDFPVESGGPGDGFFYELSVSHTLELANPLSEESLPLDLGCLVGANDGVYDVDTGGFALTHVVFNVSTSIDCNFFDVTPAFQYQISTNKAVNDEDEGWFTLSLSKSF